MSNNTYRLALMIGHNVDGKPTLTATKIQRAIERTCKITGATYIEAQGVWQGSHEDTTVAVLYADHAEATRILGTIPQLASYLQQESIYTDMQPTHAVEVHAC